MGGRRREENAKRDCRLRVDRLLEEVGSLF